MIDQESEDVRAGCSVKVWKSRPLMEIVSPLGGIRIRITKAEAFGLIGQLQQALAEFPPTRFQMPGHITIHRKSA